jgi:hypothetical protein
MPTDHEKQEKITATPGVVACTITASAEESTALIVSSDAHGGGCSRVGLLS